MQCYRMPLPPHSFSLVCSIGREPMLVVNTCCQVVPRLQFGSGQPGLMPLGLDCQRLSEGPSSSVDVSCLVQHHFHCGSWHALNICSPFPAVLRRLNKCTASGKRVPCTGRVRCTQCKTTCQEKLAGHPNAIHQWCYPRGWHGELAAGQPA